MTDSSTGLPAGLEAATAEEEVGEIEEDVSKETGQLSSALTPVHSWIGHAHECDEYKI